MTQVIKQNSLVQTRDKSGPFYMTVTEVRYVGGKMYCICQYGSSGAYAGTWPVSELKRYRRKSG